MLPWCSHPPPAYPPLTPLACPTCRCTGLQKAQGPAEKQPVGAVPAQPPFSQPPRQQQQRTAGVLALAGRSSLRRARAAGSGRRGKSAVSGHVPTRGRPPHGLQVAVRGDPVRQLAEEAYRPRGGAAGTGWPRRDRASVRTHFVAAWSEVQQENTTICYSFPRKCRHCQHMT